MGAEISPEELLRTGHSWSRLELSHFLIAEPALERDKRHSSVAAQDIVTLLRKHYQEGKFSFIPETEF